MQTFVPYPDFIPSAVVLDRARLGKQRVETLQILNSLDPDYDKRGWANHPAVKMWRGHEGALARYGLACVNEWVARGYNDIKCGPKLQAYADKYQDTTLPWWWGDMRVHLSHQSNLLRKDPEHYREFFVGVTDNLPYHWPEGDNS